MLTEEQMVHLRSRFSMFFVFFLLASSWTWLSESRKNKEEEYLCHSTDCALGQFDRDLVERIWIHCKQDFMQFFEGNRFPVEKHFQRSISSSIDINEEPYLVKQFVLNCVRKNKDATLPLNTKIQTARRKLFQASPPGPQPSQSPSPSTSPASASGPSVPAPAPSPVAYPAPSAIPNISPPAPGPAAAGGNFVPTGDSLHPTENPSHGPISPNSDHEDSTNSSSNKKTVVIAVTVTAAVTFALAGFLFLCCTRLCRGGSGGRKNDERPLLSLSLTDYSVASSNKTFGYGNSIKEEKHTTQSTHGAVAHGSKLDSDTNLKSDFYRVKVSDELASTNISAQSLGLSRNNSSLLPLPPGRKPGDSFGKQPFQKIDLPPLEPPSSRRQPFHAVTPPPVPPQPIVSAASPPAPLPPPIAPSLKPGVRPPPPPGLAPPRPPPPTSLGAKVPRPPGGPKHSSSSTFSEKDSNEIDANAPKAKLKPFFWDKVLANPDHSMVWHQIKSGSFQFNEEMIETLFGAAPTDKNKNEKKDSLGPDAANQFVQILDPKKAQNLAIMLRALNVTIEEVCDALKEGNELPVEFLQMLLKMPPTTDEELKLRLYSGDLSQLGPAERFLKALVGIPFAFKRLEALLFMCTLQDEVISTKESFETLEVACEELRNCRLFLKILEAVLKTGNRMNDGTFRGGAQAFRLDTLLKLADVKGTDGKTTLLHFVVQELVRSEGARAARAARENRNLSSGSSKTDDSLEESSSDIDDNYSRLGLLAVSQVSTQLEHVKKAAAVDADTLTGNVSKLGLSLMRTRDFTNKEMKGLEEDSRFYETLKSFIQNAEVDIMSLLEEEKKITALVKSTGDYFHGNSAKDEGLRLFVVVRDFLIILDRVCKEVEKTQKKQTKSFRKETSTASSSSVETRVPDLRQRLFPAIAGRRTDDSSDSASDSDS